MTGTPDTSPDESIGLDLGLVAGRKAAIALQDAVALCNNEPQAGTAVFGAIILAGAACQVIPAEDGSSGGPLRQAELLETIAHKIRDTVAERGI